jgi:hypothetical protein
MSLKKTLCKLLILALSSGILTADHWRWRRPRYHRPPVYGNYRPYPYDNRISPGAAAAISIGAGVVGYVIGKKTQERSYTEGTRECSYEERIECKEFEINVIIDGERKRATITKCRVNGGDWKIPD